MSYLGSYAEAISVVTGLHVRRSSKVVQASGDAEYNDQNVPVGTVVSRRVVSGLPEGMSEGGQGGGQPGGGAPAMNPQQV